jgi:hypothetical protein
MVPFCIKFRKRANHWVVGYFDRTRRNSQKKPTKNITAVKKQSTGFDRKPESQPTVPDPKWYTTDEYMLMASPAKRDATHTNTNPATVLLK